MANNRHLQHIRSTVVQDGKPKLPSAEDLLFGELAINYAKGKETISLKNDQGEIVTVHPDEIQVGTSADTILDSTKVFIDTDMDGTVEIYTKNDVNEMVSGLTNEIRENVVIGTTTPTSVNTELFVDTTTDGDPYDVYTKEQIDLKIAYLQQQIDELKNYHHQ